MKSIKSKISRRNFLRGIGATLLLPHLESLSKTSSNLLVESIPQTLATTASGDPLRLAFIYAPNGANMDKWWPEITGQDYNLSPTLMPLQDRRHDFQVLGGLDHINANALGDGPGDHARANAVFLTGVHPRKTAGADIQLGKSVDQVAAEHIRDLTPLPSLELSTSERRSSGTCDNGYSCAYQYNLSWRSAKTPNPPERNPRIVFEKLFGSGDPDKDKKRRYLQESVLDYVYQDAKRLQHSLSGNDQNKLNEYLESVRETERRIEHNERFKREYPDFQKPVGEPEVFSEYVKLMYDLLLLAFQSDCTRVASFMVGHEGTNRVYDEIGMTAGHHAISHHKKEEDKLRDIAKIDYFMIEQFGYFLDKLKNTPDGHGNLLDNSMIVYGGAIADPNAHYHTNLPILLAGHGGELNAGRFYAAPKGTPMTNLYLTLLDKMGVSVDRIGDSTGRLKNV